MMTYNHQVDNLESMLGYLITELSTYYPKEALSILEKAYKDGETKLTAFWEEQMKSNEEKVKTKLDAFSDDKKKILLKILKKAFDN